MWTASEFDNVHEFRTSADKLWTPDLVNYNGRLINEDSRDNNQLITIKSSGKVEYLVRRKIEIFCEIFIGNVATFPFDGHECGLLLGSNSYTISQVNLMARNLNQMKFNRGSSLNRWKLINVVVNHDQAQFRNETYSLIIYKFKLHRQSSEAHLIKLLVAISVITTLIVIWLPTRYLTQRLITTLIAIVVNLIILQASRQAVGYAPEVHLVDFVHVLLIVNIVSIIATVVNYYLSAKCYSNALPMKLASLVNGPVGKIAALELTGITYELRNEMNKVAPGAEQLSPVLQEEWILLATLIDRLIFVGAVFAVCVHYPRW